MKTHKERLKEYISNIASTYAEFEGVNEEYLYQNVFWPALIEPPASLLKKSDDFFGDEDIDRFYTFQIKSQRVKIFETFYRAAFKKVKDLSLDYKDFNSGLEIIENTTTLLEILFREIRFKDEEHLSVFTDDEYKRCFEIYSNFNYPIIDDILFKFKVKNDLIKHLPYLESINQAVNLYLDSEIYDKEIDRFFIVLLSDYEILNYINDIAYPALQGSVKKDKNEMLELMSEFYVSKLERERAAIKSVFKPGKFYFKSFIKWSGFALFVYILPYIVKIYTPIFNIENMEVDSTLNYSLVIMTIWFVLMIIVSIQDKEKRKKLNKLIDKHETHDEILLKMNDFYNLVRVDSPLPVSEIKKEYYKMRDLNILLPLSILSIIENLEARKVKNL
ncbi:hypothetical protein CVFO_0593 [Isorropodon fossajaponicum endosymbiont JTNG4]|uniref:hypothetical protein n=1 Tax=Isorropodon fossajaponicum symbiont TaxID=883811 RepID=UPI001914FBFC|nr:hypothetical protein [Isorropodon fossajaponicum symbiont]BBB23845.1 hypothetical protein CVFO_0593 [Isorropodon fossajaponicum endosymbiont JTNG4]